MTAQIPHDPTLSQLIQSYAETPAGKGDQISRYLLAEFTRPIVQSELQKRAGTDRLKISVSLDSLVEEARQEAVIKCLAAFRRPEFRAESDASCIRYIKTILTNTVLDLLDRHLGSFDGAAETRSKRLVASALKLEPGEDPVSDRSAMNFAELQTKNADIDEDRLTLMRHIQSLETDSPAIHQCVILYLQGLNQSEIARIMNVSDRTVRSHMNQVRVDLRRLFASRAEN